MTKIIHSSSRLKRFYFLSLILILFSAIQGVAQTTKVEKLLPQLKEKLEDTTRLRVLRELTSAYSSVDQDKKFYYAKRYKSLAEKLKIDTLVVEALIDMGGTHAIQSEMDSALYYFERGKEKAESINYQGGIARSLASIGYVYDKLDKESLSIEVYNKALAIYRKIKNKKGINQCLINIGGIYFDLTEYEMAEKYFQKAYEGNLEIGNESGTASALFSLGGASKRLNKRDKAYNYYKLSLEISEKIGDLNRIALVRWGLGTIDIERGDYKKALENLEIAREKNIAIKNHYQESASELSMATAYLGLNNFEKAYGLTKEVYDRSFKLESKNLRTESLKVFIKIATQEKNFEKAFNYQTHYIALLDSLTNEADSKRIMLSDFKRVRTENEVLEKDNKVISNKNTDYLTTIAITSTLLFLVVVLLSLFYYRYKEKKATNKLLEKQKQEIAEINSELEALNEEVVVQMELTTAQNLELEQLNRVKNKFFSIVSHDLRNPLANLKMLFSMYREGQLNESELGALLSKLEDTIYTTATFLDNLLEWSKSQLDGIIVKPNVFALKDSIDQNIHMMDNSIRMKKLHVENKISDNIKVFADPNMIHVVVRNLVSNCIKFCHPENQIIIEALEKDKKVIFSIKDTGPGISEGDLEKLFSLEYSVSLGTSGEKGHHIGLILCKDMVMQNNGQISVESEVGQGTTFWVELPSGNQ